MAKGNRGGKGGSGGKINKGNLAKLVGTEKQIKYANDIRNAYISKLEQYLSQTYSEFPERKKISFFAASNISEHDAFITEVKRLNDTSWLYHSKSATDTLDFKRSLIKSFNDSFGKDYKSLTKEERLRGLDKGYKAMKQTALKEANNILSKQNSSSFWIDKYKKVLYE
ncbi:MAG: hypothetical protein NC177_14315 [Ruminococcus flavefaciens]|nr:hypothetical protein [Ruminococcus flavefaciens]